MNVQLKKGVLEMIVLFLLSKKDYYTYELNKQITEFIDLNESTIYSIFKKLIDKKFVEYYFVDSSSVGPSRKYYKLTISGEVFLNGCIAEWNDFTLSVNKLLVLEK